MKNLNLFKFKALPQIIILGLVSLIDILIRFDSEKVRYHIKFFQYLFLSCKRTVDSLENYKKIVRMCITCKVTHYTTLRKLLYRPQISFW